MTWNDKNKYILQDNSLGARWHSNQNSNWIRTWRRFLTVKPSAEIHRSQDSQISDAAFHWTYLPLYRVTIQDLCIYICGAFVHFKHVYVKLDKLKFQLHFRKFAVPRHFQDKVSLSCPNSEKRMVRLCQLVSGVTYGQWWASNMSGFHFKPGNDKI